MTARSFWPSASFTGKLRPAPFIEGILAKTDAWSLSLVQSYNPDLESDPCAENGSLWFFNFFFYNKKLRRIVFFTCRCKKIDDDDEEDEEDEVDQRVDDDYYGSFMRSDSSSNAPSVTTLTTANSAGAPTSKPISTLIGFMDQ